MYMNKNLPILPMEIVNKILIMRPTHPNADILKNYIELYHSFMEYKVPYFIIEYDDDCSCDFDKFIFYDYTHWFF